MGKKLSAADIAQIVCVVLGIMILRVVLCLVMGVL